jgi:hypothetical protein
MELSTMANQITVSDSGTVQVAIQQLGDVQVQISRTAGALGTSGFSGYSGPPGPGGSGLSGTSGYSGTSGLSGVSGAAFVGSSGISGFSGAPGAASASGYSGTSGSSGISGYSGAAFVGSSGFSGASGASGVSGTNGSAGASGISGFSGSNGGAGASGVSGYSGANGTTGASGVSGFSGQDGSAGASGTSGYSGATGPQGISGFSGAAGAGGAQGHYGAFFDITDQAGSVTEQVVAIGSTSTASGINLAGTGEIVIQTPGVYQLTYSIQLVNTDNAIHYADIYLKYNGNVYPDSNTRFFIPARKNSSEYGYTVATVDFIGIAANANDYVELYWTTNSAANVSIDTIAAAGTTPRTPGVIVNVAQVMYTQSGYSGVSGASGVSGFSGAPGPATPGGANTEVQYNDNGSLNGSNAFTFNNSSNTVEITNLRVNSSNITLGANAGLTSQGANAVAIGFDSGTTTQGANAISIGRNAGNTTQGAGAVAIGANAASFTQGSSAVALGSGAGYSGQGGSSVAIGSVAGELVQASGAVAIGLAAGRSGQLGNAVALGRGAGSTSQGIGAVAIGWLTANTSQGANSVAIGPQAGGFSLGANSVAIGRLAGYSGTVGNTIILNATGASLNGTTANAFYVKPVRNASTTNIVNYNTSSGEFAYDGNVSTNNITATGNLGVVDINATGNLGVVNITATGDLGVVNITATGDLGVTGNVTSQGAGSFNSPADGVNTLYLTNIDTQNTNDIRIERRVDTANAGGYGTLSVYRTGYTANVPSGVANGDKILVIGTSVYGDGGNIFVDTGGFDISVDINYGNGVVSTTANYFQGSGGPGSVNFNYDAINFNGISNLGSNSNVIITGGNVSDVLTTDGSGNLSWQAQSGGGGETFNAFLLMGG